MQDFKVGQIVRHRLDGERLRIKRVSETVATCEEVGKGMIEINRHGDPTYPIRVSSFENLEYDPESL